jgi:hypothetical protein
MVVGSITFSTNAQFAGNCRYFFGFSFVIALLTSVVSR